MKVCSVGECSSPHYGHGFCNTHWARWRKHGDPHFVVHDRSQTLIDRLADRSATDGECHVWLGRVTTDGYGLVDWANNARGAHRRMWEAHNGPIPEGLIVCHHCDNPPCIRLDHLYVGTSADNAHDRDRRGRQVALRGEASGRAKLTEADVVSIRARHLAGESQEVLARDFQVSRPNVGYIVRRTTWTHVA